MLYQAHYDNAHWATVVIRADDEPQAQVLAAAVGKSYMGNDVGKFSVEQLNPDGAPDVLIEDWS